METTHHRHTEELTAQLNNRLPSQLASRADVVFENDLAGRAVLALLWAQREHLTLHVVTDDPVPDHVKALVKGMQTVRKPPDIRLVSRRDLSALVAGSQHLIWALRADRTAALDRRTLHVRDHALTHTPFFAGLVALDGQVPDQHNPIHKLFLRDLICNHARFLNFFGDRFNPRDLYQRSKHPAWIRLPEDFSGAIPALRWVVEDSVGQLLDSRAFNGRLQLNAENVLTGHRAQVEFQPVFDVLDQPVDATIEMQNDYQNPAGQGTLQLLVQQDQRVIWRQDIASSAPVVRVRLAAIPPSSDVTVSLAALADQPKSSWAKASRTDIRLVLHPLGTYRKPSLWSRLKAWFTRLGSPRHKQ